MMRTVFAAGVLALAALAPARAQVTDDVVKVGVLTDMSSLYSDINGQGAVIATQMAIDEAGGTVLGKKIELVQADVQNKPDVAVSTAGRWYDVDKVDMILGTGASSSSIATMARPFGSCPVTTRRTCKLIFRLPDRYCISGAVRKPAPFLRRVRSTDPQTKATLDQ